MDSSTKAREILGKPVFTIDELEAKDRWKIIRAALEICKPYLKYLSTKEFVLINDLLNVEREGYSRTTNENLISFSAKVDLRLRYIQITTLKSDKTEEDPTERVKIVKKKEEVLLLSQKGEFIIWSYAIRSETTKKARSGLGQFPAVNICETIESCDFSLLEEENFKEILKTEPWLVYTFIDVLYLVAHGTMQERKERLRNIERAANQLSEIKYRIKT